MSISVTVVDNARLAHAFYGTSFSMTGEYNRVSQTSVPISHCLWVLPTSYTRCGSYNSTLSRFPVSRDGRITWSRVHAPMSGVSRLCASAKHNIMLQQHSPTHVRNWSAHTRVRVRGKMSYCNPMVEQSPIGLGLVLGLGSGLGDCSIRLIHSVTFSRFLE